MFYLDIDLVLGIWEKIYQQPLKGELKPIKYIKYLNKFGSHSFVDQNLTSTDIIAAINTGRSGVRSSFPNYNKGTTIQPVQSLHPGKKEKRGGFFIKKTIIPAPRLG